MKSGINSILLVVLVFFLLSGCRQSQDNTPGSEKKSLTDISLQLQWVTQAQFAGFYVAKEKGWYEDEGINLTIHPGGPDIVPVDLVAAGSRDFGTTLLADLTSKIQKEKPVISIAQIQQENGLRLLAKKSSLIREPEDFAGRKVGVWLGGWEVQFYALLAHKNIVPENINVISQGFSMEPFIDDRLDVASAMIYNEYLVVLNAGIDKDDLVVIDYADYGLGFPGDVLFTSLSMKEQHPDLCLKMVRASMKGWQYAINHQEEAVDIVVKNDLTGVAEPDHQTRMMQEIARMVKGTRTVKIGHIDPDVLTQMTDLLFSYKIIEAPVPVDRIFTPQFVRQVVR